MWLALGVADEASHKQAWNRKWSMREQTSEASAIWKIGMRCSPPRSQLNACWSFHRHHLGDSHRTTYFGARATFQQKHCQALFQSSLQNNDVMRTGLCQSPLRCRYSISVSLSISSQWRPVTLTTLAKPFSATSCTQCASSESPLSAQILA